MSLPADQCAVGGEYHDHANPVVCTECHLRTAVNLDWIRRNHNLLAEHLEPATSGSTTRTVPASRPPLRTDVLSLHARGGLSGVLGSWVQLLVEEHQVDPPNYRLGQPALIDAQTQTLKANLTWLLEQEFAPEVVDEISQIRNDVQALFGDTERKWTALPGRWDCPVILPDTGLCGRRLRQRIGQWLVQCPECRTEWSGDQEFERLGAMLGCEPEVTIEQAASLLRVSVRTVQRLINRDNMPVPSHVAEDGRVMIHKIDLALVTARHAG